MTNEANGPSETTENRPRRTDNGQKALPAMLALLVLLVFSGLAMALAASLDVTRKDSALQGHSAAAMNPKSQETKELSRSLSLYGPSFFPARGMNAFDRCHRNEQGHG